MTTLLWFLFCFMVVNPVVAEPHQEPNHIKSIISETTHTEKLLPTPEGTGGQKGEFGRSVALDDNRALVGAAKFNVTGQAFIYEFNGVNWVETAKLVPSVSGQALIFGGAVSLEGDRAVIAAHQGNDFKGSVFVFDYDGVEWVETAILTASDGDLRDGFGYAVSLSQDRILVGAYRDDDLAYLAGAVYVYEFNGSEWVESAKIYAHDGKGGDFFGLSLDLEENIAVVGSKSDPVFNDAGSVYLYEYQDENWELITKLQANDKENYDEFGSAVNLNKGRLVVGAKGRQDHGRNSGAAYVFEFDGKSWSEVSKVLPSDGLEGDHFGYTVSQNNTSVLVGTFSEEDRQGRVYVYEQNNGNWEEVSKLSASDGSGQNLFGNHVAVFEDKLLIGAMGDQIQTGAAYVFVRENDAWVEHTKIISEPGIGAAFELFGKVLSASGNRVLVGAEGFENSKGAAYVFEFNGQHWNLMQKLQASDGEAQDFFGNSVSLDGDRAVIGAIKNSVNGVRTGSAYVFEFNGKDWVETENLTYAGAKQYSQFGVSVGVSDDKILVTSKNDGVVLYFQYLEGSWVQSSVLASPDQNGGFGNPLAISGNRAYISDTRHDNNVGAVFVYEHDGANWVESGLIAAQDGHQGHRFGRSLSVFADRVLIGTNEDSSMGTRAGAAYVFDFNGIDWQQTAKLFGHDIGNEDAFGASVALSESMALVSTPYFGNENKGVAYVFKLDNGHWSEYAKLQANEGGMFDLFGLGVELVGGTAFCGTAYDLDRGYLSGSVYVYDLNGDFDLIFRNGME